MIENERKYVLFRDRSVFANLSDLAVRTVKINQCFLQEGENWLARLRRSEIGSQSPVYKFAYKQVINGTTYEFEQDIEYAEYKALMISAVGRSITKTRLEIPYGKYVWEIDAYYDNADSINPYFILAEVELEPYETNPMAIPDFIKENLLYAVEHNEKGFGSKDLRYIESAETIYRRLITKHQGNNYEDQETV